MARALLDANVLISAAIRPSGAPGRIVSSLLARAAFDLVLSPAIVAEVEAALKLPKIRRYLREPADAIRWLADVVVHADLVADSRPADDDVVLMAAVEGRADVIVTGDGDLLALKEYEGIAIATPRTFLDSFRLLL